MIQQTITVTVGGISPLYCAALEALIANFPGLRVVVPDCLPPAQVLLWDAGPGDLVNLPFATSETAVILLVTEQDCTSVPAGVAGLFSKAESPAALANAIRQVARGEQYLSPGLALALLRRQQIESDALEMGERIKQALDALTDREREILALVADGLSNKAIAARLYLSVRTVEGHLDKLYSRLGVHSRTEVILLVVNHKMMTSIR